MTDHELVELAKRGDSSAFGELVDRHHRAALRAAMAALRSRDDAADAAQEAWLSVRARLADFRGDACFRTWLLAIVWNKAIDHRRSLIRAMTRLAGLGRRPDEDAERATPGWQPALYGTRTATPEEAAMAAQLRKRVAKLVAALPARLRDPLLLVGSGEYTYDEVATMLRQPVGTIKWRVADARRQLKTKLAQLELGRHAEGPAPARRPAAR